MSHDITSMADLLSVHNNNANSHHNFRNEDAGDFEEFECNDDDDGFEVDSMVDLEDRTYEHLFEELTVVAVDDYNNRYYAAAPHFTGSEVAESTNVGMNNYAPEAYVAVQPNAAEPIYAADGTAAASAIACENPTSCDHHHGTHHFYTAPNTAYGDKPHTSTHTHSARNAALYKSANDKYLDNSGHLGWRWGLILGTTEADLEEERVWLQFNSAPAAADSVPCRDCCRCGCNNTATHNHNPNSYNQHDFINGKYSSYTGASADEYSQHFYGYDNPNQFSARKVRRHNPYTLGYYEPAAQQQQHQQDYQTKAQQVSEQTGLTPEECEERFPYRCGVKEFVARPIMPQFPSEELGVPFVKCCYYAQRPYKKCSMGAKCYHTHDDEDGDVVPEAFADGRDRNETRCTNPSAKLSYAAVAAAAKAARDHPSAPQHDSHEGSEIATVPQSVCGHDDDEDARTTAGRAIVSCACNPCDHTGPTITRAQLATVPCQYGTGCAIPRHAMTATKCGFTAQKLARYKEYLNALRHYGVQLVLFKKARADVRAESAQLQLISNVAKANATRQMRAHMRPRAEGQQELSDEHTNTFAPRISAITWAPTEAAAQQQKPPMPHTFHSSDLTNVETTVPCKHCGEVGNVYLRSMPVYRPNPNYDGVQDRRREVRKNGVGASCGSCGKTFAFDDSHSLRTYINSFAYSSEVALEDVVGQSSAMLVKEEPLMIGSSLVGHDGSAAPQLAFVEELPW
eukprot:GILK01011603.1.p1 GENE.GILK01011603.1~~GILK01011603.1.p1  ORF type:complete len:825 (-),score=45.82 GILK01011603.1:332-2548(-)